MGKLLYFGIVDELLNGLLNRLVPMLQYIFGDSIDSLFDDFFGNIGVFLMEFIWSNLLVFINRLFYNVFIFLLFLLDLIASVFDIFIGTKNIIADTSTGAEDSLFNIMFHSAGVGRAFWGIALIACALTIAFTIFAVMRSMIDMDVKRPVGNILRLMGKSMLTFLMIPFITMAGLNLATLTLTQATKALSGTDASNNTSIGTFIYTSVIQDAIRHHATTEDEHIADVAYEVYYHAVLFVVNPFGTLIQAAIDQIWESAERDANMNAAFNKYMETRDQKIDIDYVDYKDPDMQAIDRFVRNDLKYPMDTPIANAKVRELVTQEFHRGGEGSALTTMIDGNRLLGLSRMPYLDIAYCKQFIRINYVHSVIGCIVALCVGIFMFMGAFIFARRIFEIILLYLVSPFFAATIPLDDGAKFKAWSEQFIGKVVSGYGIVISCRVFLLLIPIIFSSGIKFTPLPFLDTIIRIIIMCAAAASVLKAHTLITQITGGGSSSEAEATALGQKGFSMAISQASRPVSYVGGTISKAANTALSSATSAVDQAITQGIQSIFSGPSGRGGDTVSNISSQAFTGAAGGSWLRATPGGSAGKWLRATPGRPGGASGFGRPSFVPGANAPAGWSRGKTRGSHSVAGGHRRGGGLGSPVIGGYRGANAPAGWSDGKTRGSHSVAGGHRRGGGLGSPAMGEHRMGGAPEAQESGAYTGGSTPDVRDYLSSYSSESASEGVSGAYSSDIHAIASGYLAESEAAYTLEPQPYSGSAHHYSIPENARRSIPGNNSANAFVAGLNARSEIKIQSSQPERRYNTVSDSIRTHQQVSSSLPPQAQRRQTQYRPAPGNSFGGANRSGRG